MTPFFCFIYCMGTMFVYETTARRVFPLREEKKARAIFSFCLWLVIIPISVWLEWRDFKNSFSER